MRFGRSANVIRAGLAWRAFGSSGAGATLLEAMSGADEQERMLAGMSLVKAGERSVDLIDEAYASQQATAPMVRLLADLGGPRSRTLLTEIAAEPGPLAGAATDSLDLLDRIDALGETD
ncbi:MAG: hypothetical protein U9N79_02020 [Actinomycetota bacterium]|nr:hypothetical protein [Actinomycetota bacterium]